jgi:hypothetical protein
LFREGCEAKYDRSEQTATRKVALTADAADISMAAARLQK